MKSKKIIIFSILMLLGKAWSTELFIEDNVKQGHPITFVIAPVTEQLNVHFLVINNKGKEVLNIQGFNYYLFEEKINLILGLGGIPMNLEPGNYKVIARAESLLSTSTFENQINIVAVEYPKSVIIGNKVMENIQYGVIDKERLDQTKRLWDSINYFSPYIFHYSGILQLPVEGRHTSAFGFNRITKYPKGKDSESIHYGEDLAAKEGTPVICDGDGVVLLSEDRIVTGNTLIIQHLPGVVTIFYHMNQINVKRGDIVTKGDVVGTVGSTGYSTGPHLHWEIRFSSVPVNPMLFLTRPLIDKNLIMGMINSYIKKGG
ncbi:MAG: M23 family metallopeptidase [Spirochaetales bacterium]|nr:M23 family metallopeptidase [Spirochaetales bacterium]